MKGLRDQNIIDRRCALLESMGFTIVHEDSIVTHPKLPDDIVFDFSALHESHFIGVALQVAYHHGDIKGQNTVRQQLADLTRPLFPQR